MSNTDPTKKPEMKTGTRKYKNIHPLPFKKSLNIPKDNQNPYIEEEQTTQLSGQTSE